MPSNPQTFYPSRSRALEKVEVHTKFTGAGAADPTSVDVKHGVSGVTYQSSTGRYRIALYQRFSRFLGGRVSAVTTAGPVLMTVRNDQSAAATPYIDVDFWDAATPSALSETSSYVLHVTLDFSDSVLDVAT